MRKQSKLLGKSSQNTKVILTVMVLPFSLIVLFIMGFLLGVVLAMAKANVEKVIQSPLFSFSAMVIWFGVIVYCLWFIWMRKKV